MYNSKQNLPETIFFESLDKIELNLTAIDVSMNTQQDGMKVLPKVAEKTQTSVLKFDIVHDILLQQLKFCEQSVFKTRLFDEGKENRSNKQARIERIKQLFSLVENFKKMFFESAPIVSAPYIDDEKKIRGLALPNYKLKNFDNLGAEAWQQKVQDFLDDNHYAINYLPKLLHPTWLKSMVRDLGKLDSEQREDQAQNCFYYLLYHKDYLHMRAIDRIICHYAEDKQIDEFDIFTSINDHVKQNKLINQNFFVNYLSPIVSERGQSKIHIKHQAQLIKQLQQQLKCQTTPNQQNQDGEELKKAKLLLKQYKKKNNQLEKANSLLREDINSTVNEKIEIQQNYYKIFEENKLLKKKLENIEEGALQSKSLDPKQQQLLIQNYNEMKNQNVLLQQKNNALEDRSVKVERENGHLQKLLNRSNTLPDLRKNGVTHNSPSSKSSSFYFEPEKEKNGYFAKNFNNSPEKQSTVENFIGPGGLIFKTNQNK